AARDRVQAGLASKLEELQAESNYYNALYALEDSRGTVKDALGTVAQTVGVKADTPLAVALPQGEPPLDLPREEVGKMIDAAIAQRPDIAARRAQVGSLAAAVSAADSDLWPTLNLGGNAAGTWYSYNGDFEPYDRSWNLVGFLQINWDIFSGFSDRSAKLAAQADLESALQGLRQAELAASADVWTAYNNFGTAVEKYKAGKALFASAQASYDYALDSYKAGLDSILDLLQAQSQLSTARSKLVASRRDVHLAIAGLAYSTGSLTVASYKDETLNQ
ncbi:MAG TPA: TolC family protein, partial [bacterium]|nr:TolC family protein [bacterium]